MPKDTTMSRFGTSYSLNSVSRMANPKFKPLSPAEVKSLTPQERRAYLSQLRSVGRAASRKFKTDSKTARKNAKLEIAGNYQQAKLMHGTIRQAIAEAGAIGSQVAATNAISRANTASSAVQQNTEGGTVATSPGITEKGPVYSFREREED